jgi:homocysteine S-methyltransferase
MNAESQNPILGFLEHQKAFVLDGGLATAMEARGCDLNDELWSAKVLMEDPELIRAVHLDFLAAGADCIASASYQASLSGFRQRGLSDEEGRDLLVLSVRLATDARDEFWSDEGNREGRQKPLVAASIGPYGAYLADGSEYTGNYGISDQEVYDFHRERWHILAEAGPDLMACETIPGQREAEILIRLLDETPDQWAWISFSCRDERRLSDGGRIWDAVRILDGEPRLAAVGVNCIAPELVTPLLAEVSRETDKPILVYPNSGESYDAGDKRWHSTPSATQLEGAALHWVRAGASGVGGCCRVSPDEIAKIRGSLEGK